MHWKDTKMFGRKRPQIEAKPGEKSTDSERTTSYRTGQDAAPTSANAPKTTSYVSAMQRDGRGYETLN
jgi:hypothetical protein